MENIIEQHIDINEARDYDSSNNLTLSSFSRVRNDYINCICRFTYFLLKRSNWNKSFISNCTKCLNNSHMLLN